MSNAELYYEQLTDLSVRIAEGIKNRTDPLKDLNDKLTQLSQTNAIKGSAANSMKAYIGEVHMTLIQTLQLLLNNYEMALGKYVKGYLGVDSSESFKLVKEDFDAHERNLSSHRSDFTSIGSKLKAISDEAEDIIWLGGAGSNRLFNVAKEMDAMKKTVGDLKDSWNSYEQTDPGFNEVQELIAQTKALLKSTLSVPRGYSYSPGSFSKLMSKNFVDAFIANANYAQDANNQKAFKDDWNSISKNYTADQKRMAEEAKKKAQEEGLIGLIWDGLQICAGTALVVTGVGTGFGVVLIAGGVNSAINHASMAVNGKSFNIVGNLTNGAVQWYNKSIGEPLVKTGNPIAKFVAGLGNGAIEVAGGMGQFSVYDIGKTAYSLTNPQVRAQFGASIGNWWNQVRSGDAYTIGQTTAVAVTLLVNPEDVSAAASKASKVDSLLGKAGTFSKSIAVSSVENVNSLINLPGRTLDDLKKAAGFVNEKLLPASGKAVKDFGKLVKDSGEDLKGLNPQGEFVTDNGFAFSVGNDIKLSDIGNNFKNGVSDIKDNFVKAVKSGDKAVSDAELNTCDNIKKAINDKGCSVDEFIKLLHPDRALNVDEKALVDSIRDEIGIPDVGTKMTKVVPQSDIYKYLYDEKYTGVRGFTAVDEHSINLKTLYENYEGARLDYDGTMFKVDNGVNGVSKQIGESDRFYGTIEYKENDPSKLVIPRWEANAENYPYTAKGFTGSKNIILPELTYERGYVRAFQSGDELNIIDSETGNAVTKFKFNKKIGWVMVK